MALVANLSVVVFAIVFGALATVSMVMAMFTDHWEKIYYDSNILTAGNSSQVAVFIYSSYTEIRDYTKDSVNGTVTYLFQQYGGVWVICDDITDTLYSTLWPSGGYNKCFNYITDYNPGMTAQSQALTRTWLIRMQNSASSMLITCLIVLGAAAITGSLGIVLKQVSCCMVTGVMYSITAVLTAFSLAVYLTKIGYEAYKPGGDQGCYSVSTIDSSSLQCQARRATDDWSIILAWLSFVFCLIASGFWYYVSRQMRIVKAKMNLL